MFKGILINTACAALVVLANALLKHSLHGRISWKGSVLALFADAFSLLQYPLIWLGIAAFVAAVLLWLLVLSTQHLSVAYPLQLSLVLIFSTVVSVFVFSEPLTSIRFGGLVFLFVGILMLRHGATP